MLCLTHIQTSSYGGDITIVAMPYHTHCMVTSSSRVDERISQRHIISLVNNFLTYTPLYLFRRNATRFNEISHVEHITNLIPKLQMKITWLGMKSQVHSLAIITYDVFSSRILSRTSSDQFLKPVRYETIENLVLLWFLYLLVFIEWSFDF